MTFLLSKLKNVSKFPILKGLPGGVYDIEYISFRSDHVYKYVLVSSGNECPKWGYAIGTLNRSRRGRRWGDTVKWPKIDNFDGRSKAILRKKCQIFLVSGLLN